MSFPFDLHSAAMSDSHLICHAHAMLCRAVEKNGIVKAWHGRGMASVNQTRSHCVNQMRKTHSKPLAARHGRGMAWARHGHSMLCVNRPKDDCINCGRNYMKKQHGSDTVICEMLFLQLKAKNSI